MTSPRWAWWVTRNSGPGHDIRYASAQIDIRNLAIPPLHGRSATERTPETLMLQAITYVLVGVLMVTSAALILLVLLHKGKGGGLSSMFGGGVSSNLSGSSVAEKNLDRITVVVGILWLAAIIGFGVVLRTLTTV